MLPMQAMELTALNSRRGGFAGGRDRKPTLGMAEFGLLDPPLRFSVLNGGTDFALV
jgi:hypothetical protein